MTEVAATLDKATHRQWTEILQLAAGEVFEMMLGCGLEPQETDTPLPAEVTAVVGLAGHLCGAFSVRCSIEAAVQIAAALLGSDASEVGPQHWDAVGELCNMVAGNFKAKLPGVGDCLLSVPTVVCGADYQVRCLANGGSVEASFSFRGQGITFCMDLHSIPATARARSEAVSSDRSTIG